MNKVLPYLVSNVVEMLDLDPLAEEDGAAIDTDASKTKCCVIKVQCNFRLHSSENFNCL